MECQFTVFSLLIVTNFMPSHNLPYWQHLIHSLQLYLIRR
jgi:hypothetical protein